jgi:hypothetical protein
MRLNPSKALTYEFPLPNSRASCVASSILHEIKAVITAMIARSKP